MEIPTLPSWILRRDGEPVVTGQGEREAVEARAHYVELLMVLDDIDHAEADARLEVEVVPPAWPRADWCGRADTHAPHEWGGKGWSGYVCAGR